ncbi:MAG TPA: hypothetical protein VGS11_02810 [Candidatus Bathyarchaeia archaeon]|nr:hypothetical protein [Candidatus Bathyarchaeia archaeon]
MEPIIFEFLGGLLAGAMVGLMVVLRIKHSAPKMMPVLAIKKARLSPVLAHHRKTSHTKGRGTVTVAKTRKRAKTKTPDAPIASGQLQSAAAAMVSFDSCPSCGLQAPGSLLAEHFQGSPSHRNGPPKIVQADPIEIQAVEEAEEEDSKQSVRNLLQMLVPPRAFGRRHAHRSVGPISSIVKDLGSPHRRLP